MIVSLMKQLSISANKIADYLISLVLLLVPFHAFLTVWGSSLVGHYTVLRIWDEVVLTALVGITCYRLARDADTRRWVAGSLLVRLMLAYAVLTLLLGVISYVKGEVTAKALAYGVLVNLRYFVWFLVVLLTAQRSPFLRRNWPKLLLIPAAIVVAFAVLQYTVLPHDFLAHFGYNKDTTIAPFETINHNVKYIRVQSTLRGANPLGAYLVVVLSALGVFYIRGKRKLLFAASGVFALAALYASGSRSAWVGAALSLAVIAWLQLKTDRSRILFGGVAVAVAALAAGGYLLLKNNVSVQNHILHTQSHSTVKKTSDKAHVNALRSGIKDVLRQPLGDGPGTAGPASEYNGQHPPRIAENYYVQVAQETGWLGLAIFVSILVLIALELYERIGYSRLALVAFASFIGVAFVNMLSHAWADDTLAFLWWGLAGIALSIPHAKAGKREV
jgi:hypothetical protein